MCCSLLAHCKIPMCICLCSNAEAQWLTRLYAPLSQQSTVPVVFIVRMNSVTFERKGLALNFMICFRVHVKELSFKITRFPLYLTKSVLVLTQTGIWRTCMCCHVSCMRSGALLKHQFLSKHLITPWGTSSYFSIILQVFWLFYDSSTCKRMWNPSKQSNFMNCA